MLRISLISLFFLSTFWASESTAGTNNNAVRSFWHPTYLGQRLDYCTQNKAQCGKVVANRYCQMLGYTQAKTYAIAHNVGLTNFLESRARCVGWTCDGFMNIDCTTELSHSPPKPYYYSEKQFYHPRFNGYRVDWCYEKDKQCGRKAAFSFCRRMGYLDAKTYTKALKSYATQTIGSQALCFGPQCTSFESIKCYR